METASGQLLATCSRALHVDLQSITLTPWSSFRSTYSARRAVAVADELGVLEQRALRHLL